MARVIFVTGSLPHGGAERHAIALMNRLAERGHQCHAIYIKNSGEKPDCPRLGDGGSMHCLDAARYLDLRAVADFATRICAIQPSLVVAANPYALMYSSLALRRSGVRVPLVVTFHTTRLLGAKEWLQMLFYRPFFWSADCLVFVCAKQMRYWLRRGVFSRRNAMIYNGVDTEAFCDKWRPHERQALRRVLGFSDADYVIGISALLRPEKNHAQLVEAVALLRKRGIPARALMIGDGTMRAAVEALARSLEVQSDVVITGLKRDVRPYVVACDCMALCSFTETFSLAAIEAMAMGKPVVHSDVGGAAEMIVPGRNGFLFPVGDTKAFADKLALLASREVRTRMGQDARAIATARFSEVTMVDRYDRMLLEIGRGCESHSA